MTSVLAIDPGNEFSALVMWNGSNVEVNRYEHNEAIILRLYALKTFADIPPLVIEKVACYGMAVGETVFETVYWSGRFCEAYGPHRVNRMPRLSVKMHLCHDSRAKDQNIRQALLDRFGGKEKAIGRKSSPGPLYGISGDLWAALAVAITWHDQQYSDRPKNDCACKLEAK